MPEFGVPKFVRPENISVPGRKGHRRTTFLREDSQRELTVPREEFCRVWDSADWKQDTGFDKVLQETEKGGRKIYKYVPQPGAST